MKFLLLPVKIHIVPVPSLWSQGQYRLWSATETVSSGVTISWLLDDSCKFYSNSYFHTCKKKIRIAIIQSYCLLKISFQRFSVSRLNILAQQKDKLPLIIWEICWHNSYPWGGQFPRATAVICHLCTSLLSARWCNAQQQIRLAAGWPPIFNIGSPVTYQMKTD